MTNSARQIIRIKRGPQFGRRFSIVFLLASFALFFPGVNFIANGEVLKGLACFGVITLFMPIFLDYQGIEIDLQKERIRMYSSFLGWRFGTWISTVGFDEIELKWERIKYRSGGSFGAILGGPTKAKRSDVYCIYINDFLNGHRVEIADFQTYKGAKQFLYKYSKVLGMRTKDTYKEVKEKAMERRHIIESRRRR